jgi:DNA-binding transcriptional LysR family regulator
VAVRFQDVPIEDVLTGLQDGSVDVGFGPVTAVDDELIVKHVLWTDPLWVALHPDDPLARTSSLGWKDLRAHTLITYMREFSVSVLSSVPPRSQPARVVPVLRVNTALSMLKTIGGAVIAPSMAATLVSGFGLEFRPLRHPVVRRSISMFVRRRTALSPAVESFLGFTREFAPTWAASGVREAIGEQ